MLQQDAKYEPVDLWFSYSGSDEALVQPIYDLLNSQKEFSFFDNDEFAPYLKNDSTKAKGQSEIDLRGSLEKARITPKKYKWERKTGEDGTAYYLAPSQSINQLILKIANCALRVVVLSEDYFQSPVCLQELCMCLCSNHGKSNISPMFLTTLKDTPEVFLKKKLTFQIPSNTQSHGSENPNRKYIEGETTLIDALNQTFDYLQCKYGTNVQGFNLEKKPDFECLFKGFADELYVEAKDSQFNTQETYRFFFSSLASNGMLKPDWNNYLSVKYDGILEDEKISEVFLSHSDNALRILDHDGFTKITNLDHALKALYEIKRRVANNQSKFIGDTDRKGKLGEACTLIILKALDSFSPSLIPYQAKNNGLISVKTDSIERLNFINQLYAGLAFSIASRNTIRFDECINDTDIEACGFKEIASTRLPRSRANDDVGDELCKILKNIVIYLAPQLIPDIPNSVDEIKANSKLKKDIRRKLKRLQREEKSIAVLITTNSKRSANGYYQVLEDLFEFLNHQENEKHFLPVIELSIGENTEESLASFFTQETYEELEDALAGIFSHTKQPA